MHNTVNVFHTTEIKNGQDGDYYIVYFTKIKIKSKNTCDKLYHKSMIMDSEAVESRHRGAGIAYAEELTFLAVDRLSPENRQKDILGNRNKQVQANCHRVQGQTLMSCVPGT